MHEASWQAGRGYARVVSTDAKQQRGVRRPALYLDQLALRVERRQHDPTRVRRSASGKSASFSWDAHRPLHTKLVPPRHNERIEIVFSSDKHTEMADIKNGFDNTHLTSLGRLQALAKTMRSGGTPSAITAATSAVEAQSNPAPSSASTRSRPTSPASRSAEHC